MVATTVAAVDQQRARAERKASPPLLPADSLSVEPALRGSQGMGIPMGGWVEGKRAARGVADMVERLRASGVQLEVIGGQYLLASAPEGRMTVEVRELLRRYEQLILGHLIGEPLRCGLCGGSSGQPAVTMAEPSLPVCELHMATERRRV
jgi:hypothetical protein